MRRTLPLTLTILAAMALSSTARAADGPPLFGESIDVRVVNVEAVVTDRAGNRVTGLKPGDFRLRIDGKEVPIEYFSEVHDGNALPPPAAGPAAASPAGAQPAAEAAGVQGLTEGPVGTYYLVFVDDFFSIAAQRNAVLKAMKADLSRLGPNDRMAIVAYDGGRLAMLSNWSGSPADLGKAFDQAMKRNPRGFDRVTEGRSFANDRSFSSQTVADGSPLASDISDSGSAIIYKELLVNQLKGDVQAAVSAMRGFAAPHGRKVMLLLSGGWPFSVQTYVSGPSGMPSKQVPDGEEIFGPLARTANLLGYTLYPVDLPGLQTGAADITAAGPAFPTAPALARGNSATADGGAGAAASVGGLDSGSEQEVEGSLTFLAQQTGGKALFNSNRTLALAAAKEDTRSFYWLGFSPTWQRNDKGHNIKLEARTAGLRVRSRTGFLDLSRKAEVSMEVESALLFGNVPGGLQMPMKVGTLTRSRGVTEIPLTLGLPVSVMTVLPVDGKYAAQLELRFAASDELGNDSEVPVLPVTLKSAQPPVAGHFVRYDTKLKLHGKATHLVVAVYDPLSGKIATAETDVK